MTIPEPSNSMTLFERHAFLLELYSNLYLAARINPDVEENNILTFCREFLLDKITEQNKAWLTTHLNKQLRIKHKSFLNHLKHDYIFLLTIAKLNYELSKTTDKVRFIELLNSMKKHIPIAVTNEDQYQIPDEEFKRFEMKGLFFIRQDALDITIDREKLSGDIIIKCACIANSPIAFHNVKDVLAKFGFSFNLPKFNKGKNHIFDISIHHESDAMKSMIEIGRVESQ